MWKILRSISGGPKGVSGKSYWEKMSDRYEVESLRYKGWCLDSWKTIRSQQKGMKRMARKIKRLRAEKDVLVAGIENMKSQMLALK